MENILNFIDVNEKPPKTPQNGKISQIKRKRDHPKVVEPEKKTIVDINSTPITDSNNLFLDPTFKIDHINLDDLLSENVYFDRYLSKYSEENKKKFKLSFDKVKTFEQNFREDFNNMTLQIDKEIKYSLQKEKDDIQNILLEIDTNIEELNKTLNNLQANKIVHNKRLEDINSLLI